MLKSTRAGVGQYHVVTTDGRRWEVWSIVEWSAGQSNERGWHVFEQDAEGSTGEYVETFYSKRAALAWLDGLDAPTMN